VARTRRHEAGGVVDIFLAMHASKRGSCGSIKYSSALSAQGWEFPSPLPCLLPAPHFVVAKATLVLHISFLALDSLVLARTRSFSLALPALVTGSPRT